MGPLHCQCHLLRFRGKKGTAAFLSGLHFTGQGSLSLQAIGRPPLPGNSWYRINAPWAP